MTNLDNPPVESIQYLLDVFIEGGWTEEEDVEHIDRIDEWLQSVGGMRLPFSP